ncbi:MAG TPA: hypothetical protein V6C89_17845 [Drouetiella sp.]
MKEVTCQHCNTPQPASNGSCRNCSRALITESGAELTTVQDGAFYSDADAPIFYPVSRAKFILLVIVTLGWYAVYWSYRNWRYVQVERRRNVSAALRALFSFLFMYSLADEVRIMARKFDVASTVNPRVIGVGFALIVIGAQLGRFFAPLYLLPALSFIPLLPVVQEIDNINWKADRQVQSGFTTEDVVFLALWCVVIGLAVMRFVLR